VAFTRLWHEQVSDGSSAWGVDAVRDLRGVCRHVVAHASLDAV
jgi:hypothetical protein